MKGFSFVAMFPLGSQRNELETNWDRFVLFSFILEIKATVPGYQGPEFMLVEGEGACKNNNLKVTECFLLHSWAGCCVQRPNYTLEIIWH